MAVLVVANHTGTTLGGGAYTLKRRIGEGDFGVVYVAEQRSTGLEVAVKVLKHRVPSRVFWGEVHALGRVNHEYACGVLDARGEPDGTMWIAMPLVEGETLSSWLNKYGPMPLGQVDHLVRCIAGALQEAHENGVVHRDLKPANIMVRERKGELIPTLLDFGIAKWIEDAGGSIAGSSDGARAYRAPECWKDPQSAGPASDTYALGAVTYECLAGRHPFGGAVMREEWEHAHCSRPIVPIGDNPPGVFAALFQALAKRPEERPTARAFADALHAAFVASLPEVLKVTSLRWDANGRSDAHLTLSPKDIALAERMKIAEDDVVQAACLKAHKRKR